MGNFLLRIMDHLDAIPDINGAREELIDVTGGKISKMLPGGITGNIIAKNRLVSISNYE